MATTDQDEFRREWPDPGDVLKLGDGSLGLCCAQPLGVKAAVEGSLGDRSQPAALDLGEVREH
ncbi:MAG: hypothetical protein WKF46_10560 [Candidatus Limnocylindrales bacterium]